MLSLQTSDYCRVFEVTASAVLHFAESLFILEEKVIREKEWKNYLWKNTVEF